MASFQDAEGRKWAVNLDGLLLEQIESETGIDLADLSAGGIAQVEQKAASLVRVLSIVCGDEIGDRNLTARDFSRGIRGAALVSGFGAIVQALRDFFPPSAWSEIESRLTTQRQVSEAMSQAKPILRTLGEKDVPESIREAILDALIEVLGGSSSANLSELLSVSGRGATPSTPVSSSPENAESHQAA